MAAGISRGVVAAWISSSNVSPQSARDYEYQIMTYSGFLEAAGIGLEQAGARDLERFARKMRSEHAESMANSIISGVRRFYRWAAAQGLCRDIARDLVFEDGWSPYSRKPLGTGEALRVIDAACSARDRAMLSLAVRCDLRPRDILGATLEGLFLGGCSGEIRLADGSWMPLTRACAVDLREHVGEGGAGAAEGGRLFTATRKINTGHCLEPRTLRGIFHDAFADAGLPHPAGEYATGSAALALAVEEGEPLEVVVALCDRSYPYRKRRKPD